MTVNITATTPAVPAPPRTIHIDLCESDARVLRNLIGGLRLHARREAVERNGGKEEAQARAASLGSELIRALDAVGVYAYSTGEVPEGDND